MAICTDSSHAAAVRPEEWLGPDQHESAVHQYGNAARIFLAGPLPLVLRIVPSVDKVAVIYPPVYAVAADFV